MILLPKLPSELIRLAVRDLKTTVESGITIDMNYWGYGERGLPHCSVCFAGSVMLQTTRSRIKTLETFDNVGINAPQYNFLDSIRRGELKDAMEYLGHEKAEEDPLNPYLNQVDVWKSDILFWKRFDNNDPFPFYTQLIKLANFLEAEGY